MAEKGILFNTEMVRAILEGRKTQTRRPIKPTPRGRLCYSMAGSSTGKWGYMTEICQRAWGYSKEDILQDPTKEELEMRWTPPCHTDDLLYVRETWFYESHMEDLTAGKPDLPSGRYKHRYVYYADQPDYPVRVGAGADGWRPSIHMPKEAARIWLKVTNVSVQQLKEITEDEAIAEGFEADETFKARERFAMTWNSVYGFEKADGFGMRHSTPENWAENPWIWVIKFEQVDREAVR